MRPVLLVLALTVFGITVITTSAHAAGIYRHVDANGKVVFTDQPPEHAEEVDLPKINTVPAEKANRSAADTQQSKKEVFTGYQSLTLGGVEAGATLYQPEGPVSIYARMEPPLQPGHRLSMRHNETSVETANGSYTIPHIDRGSHRFQAEIHDGAGKLLIASTVLEFHVQRPVVSPRR